MRLESWRVASKRLIYIALVDLARIIARLYPLGPESDDAEKRALAPGCLSYHEKIMIKYIMLLLIGIGVYIGVTYKDQIEDFVDSRPAEEMQDFLEEAKDQVSDKAGDLSEKLEDLNP